MQRKEEHRLVEFLTVGEDDCHDLVVVHNKLASLRCARAPHGAHQIAFSPRPPAREEDDRNLRLDLRSLALLHVWYVRILPAGCLPPLAWVDALFI